METHRAQHIFITSDLGCEVGLTALARFLLPKEQVAWANIKMAEIRKPETLCNTLEKLGGKPASLSLCGDFWADESLELVRNRYPGVCVYNYKFDGVLVEPQDAPMGEKPTTPVGFILARAGAILGDSPMLRFAADQHSRALSLLDARCLGVRVAETQPFFTGLCNIRTNDNGLDLEGLIFGLLCGEFTLDKVLAVGLPIVRSQIDLARERALKNARKGMLKGGVSYVVTDGPELINLTHDELHAKHPDAKVTIVASLRFAETQPDAVAHSMRSWCDVDVKQIVGAYGGGSPTAAGARREVNISLDY